MTTFGCRLNQAETDAMAASLERAGHHVADGGDVDVVVLNTCTITDQADADARQAVRRVRRQHPHAKVVVTGCYANANPQVAAALPGVDVVLGNGDKDRLLEVLGRAPAEPLISVSSLVRRKTLAHLPAARASRRTRALLKIQDGCNYRCSFCIVPQVRGPSRSLSPQAIIEQLQRLVSEGAPEVVLTGIHLGTWGRDLRPRLRLVDLVERLLPHLGGARLRLSSIDPHEVDERLIDVMAAESAICRHLHLPVQSGDPEILRAMRRGHTADDFRRLVGTLAKRVEGISIGTDVIVGFPGETEAAFERTRSMLATLPVTYHHVFRYSPRQNTAAAEMSDQVPAAVKSARNQVLRELSETQSQRFAQGFAGCTLDAVLERRSGGDVVATTDNYLRLPVANAPAGVVRALVTVDAHGAAAVRANVIAS